MSEKIVRLKFEENITEAEHKERLGNAQNFILSKPDNSVLMLTILEEKLGNGNMVENHKIFSKSVSPKIRKSAVVGASLATGIAIKAIQVLTGRSIKTFRTVEEAVDWLRS